MLRALYAAHQRRAHHVDNDSANDNRWVAATAWIKPFDIYDGDALPLGTVKLNNVETEIDHVAVAPDVKRVACTVYIYGRNAELMTQADIPLETLKSELRDFSRARLNDNVPAQRIARALGIRKIRTSLKERAGVEVDDRLAFQLFTGLGEQCPAQETGRER